MKRYLLVLVAVVLVSAMLGTVAAAQSSPMDAYIKTTSPNSNYNTTALSAVSSNVSVCNPTDVTYLQWSLAGVNLAAASGTTLRLNVNFVFGSTGNLELFQVLNDGWNETTIISNTAPALGPSITSVPIPAGTGLVTFTGQALANYVNQESAFVGGADTTPGDNIISFGVKVTGCSGNNMGAIFDSKEKVGGIAPTLGLSPTAVTLSTFRAADPAVNWPLTLAVGLLGLALVVSLIVYRKRAAVRA